MSTRNAIVTLCIGDKAAEWAAISHPTMKAYAKRIGADFRVMTERRWPDLHIFFEKFQLVDLLEEYERIVLIDGDAAIRDTTPSLFEVVPFGKFGGFNSKHHVWIDEMMDIGGIPSKDWKWNGIYLNTGVAVLDRTHRDIYKNKPVGRQADFRWGDQGYANWYLQFHGLPVHELPREYNLMPLENRGLSVSEMAERAYIVHAGAIPHAEKLNFMRSITNIWFPPKPACVAVPGCPTAARSRHAIATLCVGVRAEEYGAISHPTMRAYAKKIGADLHVMSERRWPDLHIHFEKFQMYDIVMKYERTLYLDSDVIVAPDAPDIFGVTPEGQLAFLNEYDHLLHYLENFKNNMSSIMKMWSKRDLASWIWQKTYFNAGVFVIEPRFAWILKEKPEWKKLHGDQKYVNFMIHEHNLPVFRLPLAFNYMPFHFGGSVEKESKSHFIHASYPGHDWRMREMGKIIERLGGRQ